MKIGRKIELLAPAKNLECGIEAINHGADAVYIGAPKFGARSAAGNSIEDIRQLCSYAHSFFCKVYVALNTIILDSEIEQAEQIAWEVYHAGADALIIQDMGFLQMNLPPIPIHASTQADNRSIEKVAFLEKAGFSQVVLARELSLDEIKDIAKHTSVALEVFVHGALCVCYSGQCYISQALSGRSANRGECAQYCRLPYTLKDADGNILASNKHLLSLKDLNLSGHIEELLDAGATSLKIEGRLKDLSYVKNITAYYRKKLDEIFLRRKEYLPASSGQCTFFFNPDPAKSFNRGFTTYFLKKRSADLISSDSPKSIGEVIGNIKDLDRNYFTYSGNTRLNNGDGLCFINKNKELEGFRVNKVENGKVFPVEMPRLYQGITLYRNYNHEFEKELSRKSSERKIGVSFLLEETDDGYRLTCNDDDNCQAQVLLPFKKEIAQKNPNENIRIQLSKLGNTVFELKKINIHFTKPYFIPSSVLSELKRSVIERLISEREQFRLKIYSQPIPSNHSSPENKLTYLGNVANRKAKEFYLNHAVKEIGQAFELNPQPNVPLMFTKHCLRYMLGCCKNLQKSDKQLKEPLTLHVNNQTLQVRFNCSKCEMIISQ